MYKMEEKFLRRALDLAEKSRGFTSPNPVVGALLERNGKILSEGWHKKAGSSHAEITALKSFKGRLKGVCMYVSLEPCCFVGKTGACTEAILEAGVEKVIVGMKDPNPLVSGKGVKLLRQSGVEVEVLRANTVLAKDIRAVNQPYIKYVTKGLPYVVVKAGMSVDGKIALKDRKSRSITSDLARRDARVLRSEFDAVLVGNGTVDADDCELAAHGKFRKKSLLRVVVDRRLSLRLGRKVFRDQNVLVACTDMASLANQARFRRAGFEFKSYGERKINIELLLKDLARRGVTSLFVEGGSTIHGLFHDAALKNGLLVDKFVFYIDNRIIGGRKSLPVIGGMGVSKLDEALELSSVEYRLLDSRTMIVEYLANQY